MVDGRSPLKLADTFSKALKHYMVENDIPQNVIAEKCGLSKQAISNLFNRNNISLEKMEMLAKAVGCEVVFSFKSLEDTNENP